MFQLCTLPVVGGVPHATTCLRQLCCDVVRDVDIVFGVQLFFNYQDDVCVAVHCLCMSRQAFRRAVGKGMVYVAGFMPGISYFDRAIPLRPVDRGSLDSVRVALLCPCVCFCFAPASLRSVSATRSIHLVLRFFHVPQTPLAVQLDVSNHAQCTHAHTQAHTHAWGLYMAVLTSFLNVTHACSPWRISSSQTLTRPRETS